MSGLPRRSRGRQSLDAIERYEADLAAFCARILQINSRLDFQVSARGWGYLLEGDGTITKGDLDAAEKLINDCRKSGLLPLTICAADVKRSADGLEYLDDADIEARADAVVAYAAEAHLSYTPISFWDELDVYIELLVEKIDLKNLFAPVCAEFHIARTNCGGWNDINSRAAIMRRFARHEAAGQQCVLLYCGDHDPGGLNISGFLLSNFADLERSVGWSPNRLVVERFGLNFDFIEAQGLTWIDNLETNSGLSLDDPRHPDHNKLYVQSYLRRFGARKVEANALVTRPAAGRELCREAIERYVPADALERYQGRLDEVREELRQAIEERLGGGRAMTAMRSRDLAAEYISRLRAMTLDDVRELVALGIPVKAVSTVCPAPCPIRFTNETREHYEPDDDGDRAFIFPATVPDRAWPELLETIHPIEIVAGGAIVDLVACHPQSPRHALRTGEALTLGAIDHQYWSSAPVRVHRTVVSWLRASCSGVVLLTRDPCEAARVLREIAVIEPEDDAHAAELQRLLHMPMPTSSIVITRPADNQ